MNVQHFYVKNFIHLFMSFFVTYFIKITINSYSFANAILFALVPMGIPCLCKIFTNVSNVSVE